MNILAYSEMWKVFAVVCVPVCGGLKNGSLGQLASVSAVKLSDSVVLKQFVSVNAKTLWFYLASSASSMIIRKHLNLELKTIHVQTFRK